jgi:hypothetical protein
MVVVAPAGQFFVRVRAGAGSASRAGAHTASRSAGMRGSSAVSGPGATPFASGRDPKRFPAAYHRATLEACDADHVDGVDGELHAAWRRADFVDEVHLSARDGQELARLIAPAIRARGPGPGRRSE